MSILKSTNSGLLSMPLTPETAQALGWKIKQVYENTKRYSIEWKSIDMERDDIYAPIQFWYEPKDKLKHCFTRPIFFSDDVFNLSKTTLGDKYIIATTKELFNYLQFLLEAKKCETHMKEMWNTYMKNLKIID